MAPRTPKDPSTKPAKPDGAASLNKKASDANKSEPSGLRLKDLIDSVTQTTGVKKPEVKKVIEETLTALGKALGAGTALNLPQLGKVRVVKNNGTVLTLKLRLGDAPKAAGLALADEGEDD
jgi:Bacterial DNA-binding protein